MEQTPKTRSFIAVNLPAEIKYYLADLVDQLRKINPEQNIKWVNPDGIHFTLHFLGYLNQNQLDQIKKIINQSVFNRAAIDVELTELGGFPNLKRPRVLFVGCHEINNQNILTQIQNNLGQELKKLKLDVDSRPWQMHLTLARLKIPSPVHLPKLKIKKLKFTVFSIDLMKSELHRTGAQYSIIEKFFLL